MAFVHSKNTKVLVDQFDLSGYLSNTDPSWDIDLPESSVYGVSDRTYIAGLRTMTLSMSGYWDQGSSITPEPVLPDRLGQEGVVLLSYAPAGLTTGYRVYSMQSRFTNYSVQSPVDGIVTINLDVQGTDMFSDGVSLHALTAETSSAGAEEPYEHDVGGLATSGQVVGMRVNGFLHLTNLSSSVKFNCKLQHSSDSSSWTDLKAFEEATAETAERITTLATVKRYARCWWALTSGTGADSATFSVIWHDHGGSTS